MKGEDPPYFWNDTLTVLPPGVRYPRIPSELGNTAQHTDPPQVQQSVRMLWCLCASPEVLNHDPGGHVPIVDDIFDN